MSSTALRLLRVPAWLFGPALLVWSFLNSTFTMSLGEAPLFVAMVACWSVGAILTYRVLEQSAGWAFLGLGTAMAWSAFTEVTATKLLDDDHAAGPYLAVLADSSWLWWFVHLALALQLTIANRGRATRVWAWAIFLTGLGSQVFSLLRTSELEGFPGVTSPLAVSAMGGVFAWASWILIMGLGALMIASVVRLLFVWLRAHGEDRRRLLWLVAGVLPILPCTAGAYIASWTGGDFLAGLILSVAIISTTVGAMLAVLRYRLYDVERVLSESAGYAVAAAAVLAAYGLVLLVIAKTTPLAATSRVATIVATLAGVAVARQAYIWANRAVGRRLNRRRFDAVESVRTAVQSGVDDLDAVIAGALDDPDARVLYPAGEQRWVTAHGAEAEPLAGTVPVRSALLTYNPNLISSDLAEAVAGEAATEIDNVALRAELARQVALVTESRARLANAHIAERQRIERDLHDGAQQRVLAIALTLRSARVNGDPAVLDREVDRAIEHLGMTVRELRELASGIQPLALSTGGLHAAVADLADRLPVPIAWDVPDTRHAEAVEAAAWFVIAESVTNAVKHSDASELTITVAETENHLHVTVSDDGRGGADPAGHGLRGLADRVEANGGSLQVGSAAGGGTQIKAVLPCGW